ncbi:hypothetical protein DER46DRAFT_570008 [Fusarium sp. MPI-SDFR-AT-0072]|nr:hypothetical protein DER46DRAFT_570008 [Fusarium sp. MPI-SDFR-AT-0072]
MLMAPIRHFRPGQVFSVQPLEHNGVTYHPASPLELKRNLDGIAPFCKHCKDPPNLQVGGSIIDPTPAQSSPQVTKSSAIPGSSVSECQSDDGFPWNWDIPMFRTNLKLNDHFRDLVEEAKSLERDGNSCVVLDTANPMVSHTIPYAWNDTKRHNNTTGDIKFRGPGLLSVNLLGGSCYVCNPHELGGTDRVWNMICLHPDLHKLWARGYCGFKYIFTETSNENESKVMLQFRWMSQTKKRLGQEIDISGTSPGSDWRQLIDELNLFHDQGVIDIQWACILFAAFSGTAGNPELLSMQNPDDKTMQWIQSQARWADEQGHDSELGLWILRQLWPGFYEDLEGFMGVEVPLSQLNQNNRVYSYSR